MKVREFERVVHEFVLKIYLQITYNKIINANLNIETPNKYIKKSSVPIVVNGSIKRPPQY